MCYNCTIVNIVFIELNRIERKWKILSQKDTLLKIENLTTSFRIDEKYFPAVDDVSIELRKNEVLAIVGESGCGKSTLATSIVGLHSPLKTKSIGKIIFWREKSSGNWWRRI